VLRAGLENGFEKPRFLGFKKKPKKLKVKNLGFLGCLFFGNI